MTSYLSTVTANLALLLAILVSESMSQCPVETQCTRGMNSPHQLVIVHSQELNKNIMCDTQTNGGGWIMVLFREHHTRSYDFNRNWTEYREGFGAACGEHWLGLRYLHQLTSTGNYELWIDMETRNGKFYAGYNIFSVGNEASRYTLNVGGYMGNLNLPNYLSDAGDSLGYHNNKMFATMDIDLNGTPYDTCGEIYLSGWWFTEQNREPRCFSNLLTGHFDNADTRWRPVWKPIPLPWHNELIKIEMKIRRK